MDQLKIVSGGQTGADRAALDWALAHGVPCGGWCPLRRMAADGRIADRYPLTETPSWRYEQRTEWNARDSDGTVLFSIAAKLSGGSGLTAHLARKHQKPCLHLSRETLEGASNRAAKLLKAFVEEHSIQTLNVAGPRAVNEPEVGAWVQAVLTAAFSEPKQKPGQP